MNSTTSNNIERHYPLLETCNITLRSKNGNDRPPIHLPNDIVEWYQKQVEHQQQLNNKSNQKSGNSATTTATISTIPKPYDFALEHEVLCNKNDHDNELLELYQVNSKDELQRNVVARMKSLTNASDEVCVSILERNAYNLNTSIETYLASSK